MSKYLAAVLLAVAGTTTNVQAAPEAASAQPPTRKICTVKEMEGRASTIHSISVASEKECADYAKGISAAFSTSVTGAYFEELTLKRKVHCNIIMTGRQPFCKIVSF